jgi:hypothetical protein
VQALVNAAEKCPNHDSAWQTVRVTELAREPASVFVNWIDLGEDLWAGVWQQGNDHNSVTGPRNFVVPWALAQQATFYWIFDGRTYVPLVPQDHG